MKFSDVYVNYGKPTREKQARQRRVELFQKVTGLEQVLFDSRNYRLNVISGIPRDWIDHCTLWSSETALFGLTEPYLREPPPTSYLPYIEVPIPLAPYCGCFSAKPNEIPRTRSWLFCESAASAELRDIQQRLQLAARNAPAWNTI